MVFQFEIDDESVARLSKALDHPISTFQYNSEGLPICDQKKAFMIGKVAELCNSICFNSERQLAIETGVEASEQAREFTVLNILGNETTIL